ncbi:hypothetical protein C5167_020038 [Papaver somniferum]|uniref:Cytochrome P450 n=1 Tax=Papaver somniferum TaxID=3469 RepID=A0A4Y7IW28_PAPSO|nr:cytochrome P450 CYP749A22-like [Papaver somniferum]RZC51615.1 hypothetical protein C5167_020038 [Papaver somniferum]
MGTEIFYYLIIPIWSVTILLYLLIRFLHKVWWKPIHIQNSLASQGIRGPPYKFLYGNTQEMFKMVRETMKTPMENYLQSHNIFPQVQPYRHSWINIYGKNFLSWRGPEPLMCVTEPELMKEILNNKDGVYLKPETKGHVKMILGNGLSMINGEKWVQRRKLANHAFYAESLKGMVPAMITAVEVMLEKWKYHEGKEIDVYEEFRILTSEVISRTAFGSSYLEGKNIFEMLTKLVKLGSTASANSAFKIRLPFFEKFWRSKEEVEMEKIYNGIRNSVLEIIKKREEMMKRGELSDGYGRDYLGLLLNANKDPDELKRISVQDMVDECKTMYFAGHETTASLLTWTCLLLAIHTDWQDQARKEVIELMGEKSQIFDEKCIAKLKIVNMIINESLRLYPPVLGSPRTTESQVRLGKFTLPSDMNVGFSIIAVHHDPKIWGEDVHKFKPDRFGEGIVKATNNNPMAFIPFGYGPRTCVASNFAMIESKIALAMILRSYYFTLSPAYAHSPVDRMAMRPQHGLQIILHKLD